MQKVFKFLFLTSLLLIIAWIIMGLILTLLPIEFGTTELKRSYYTVRLYGFPVAVFFALIYSVKKQERPQAIALKTFIAILLSVLSFLILAFIFLQPCDWLTRDLLFTNKNKRATTYLYGQ